MIRATTEIADEYTNSTELTESEWHRLLSVERRRLALDVLSPRSESVGLDDLAADVVAREEGLDAGDEEALERVKVMLHHVHLPVMADLDVLDYEPDTHRIDP